MSDCKLPPVSPQVFRDEATVTVVRDVLAAEQAASFDDFGIDPLFDLALFHQFQEGGFIEAPVALVLLVGIEDVLGGCEQRTSQDANRESCPRAAAMPWLRRRGDFPPSLVFSNAVSYTHLTLPTNREV